VAREILRRLQIAAFFLEPIRMHKRAILPD